MKLTMSKANKAREREQAQAQAQARKREPAPAPAPAPAIIHEAQHTSQERQPLLDEYKVEKDRVITEGRVQEEKLIAAGEQRKSALISEGEAEKEKIISKANKEADRIVASTEKDKDRVIASYKEEITDTALQEAGAAKDAVIQEALSIKETAEKEAQEIQLKLQSLNEKSDELESRLHSFLLESTKLDAEKATYKVTILVEFRTELDSLKAEKQSFEDEKKTLIANLEKSKKTISALEVDKQFIEEEVDQNIVRRQDILALQSRINLLSAENKTIDRLYQECKIVLTEKDALMRKYGDDPNKALEENVVLIKENTTLKDRLSNCPSEDELKILRDKKQKFDSLATQFHLLEEKKVEIERELQDARIYKDDLENYRRFIKVLELQKSELQKELDRIIGLYNNQSSNVFPSLSKIDGEVIPASHSKQGITLKALCVNFKNYLTSRDKNPLYYSDKHIRTFIAAFATTRLLILEGMSGTGKSSLPKAFMEYLDCVTDKVPVQSSWKDRNDLLGFYNDFEKRYKETEFLKSLYRATRDSDNIHCIVLDEMNLSRIEYYFADLLSVLEDDEERNWKINLIPDDVRGEMPEYVVDGQLQARSNTWFIGTANKDDSTFTITDKVYDRAIVLDFKKREDKPKSITKALPIHMNNSEFQALIHKAVKMSADDADEIKNIVKQLDDYMQTYFEISFGNRISKQISLFVPAYMACGGNVYEAIDVIFSTKVLRKLQGLYDESTKNNLNTFLDDLNDMYQNSSDFELTKSAIKKMIERI